MHRDPAPMSLVNSGSSYMLVFNTSQLSDTNVAAENVRWRKLLHREKTKYICIKLAKLGDAIAISKSETMNHSVTH